MISWVSNKVIGTPLVDLARLAQYIKPTIRNLVVKLDSSASVVESNFFQSREVAKIKPISSR